jgi:rhamnosyltransferase
LQGIAATVVLYNPDSTVLDNIETFLNQVERLYVIDNSEKINKILIDNIQKLPIVKYICNNSNLGIAAALNIGAEEAIRDGYSHLLTMDQDSKATEGMVKKLYQIISSFPNIGIVAAEHVNLKVHTEPKDKITEEILFTMTSGNLLSLSAYKIAGQFMEKLFIDHVDHEFCLRLNKLGFKIIKTSEAIVYHKLGKAVNKKFFHFNFCPSNHPPIRLYYRTRNRFYVNRIYKKVFPNYLKIDRWNMFRELIEIFFYEKDLWNKTKMILLGYIHYKKNIMGKFPNN